MKGITDEKKLHNCLVFTEHLKSCLKMQVGYQKLPM